MERPRDTLLVTFVVAALLTLLSILVCKPSVHATPVRSMVSRVRADQRALSTAIEAYVVEHGILPHMVPLDGANALIGSASPGLETLPPSVKAMSPGGEMLDLIDPFTSERRLPFAYFEDGKGWILISAGPDRKYDIMDPASVYDGGIAQ